MLGRQYRVLVSPDKINDQLHGGIGIRFVVTDGKRNYGSLFLSHEGQLREWAFHDFKNHLAIQQVFGDGFPV